MSARDIVYGIILLAFGNTMQFLLGMLQPHSLWLWLSCMCWHLTKLGKSEHFSGILLGWKQLQDWADGAVTGIGLRTFKCARQALPLPIRHNPNSLPFNFWDTVSLNCTGWPWIHDPIASISQVAGSTGCSMPGEWITQKLSASMISAKVGKLSMSKNN